MDSPVTMAEVIDFINMFDTFHEEGNGSVTKNFESILSDDEMVFKTAYFGSCFDTIK